MKPATRLLRWYRIHGRSLPWRNTRDPYRILVSEVMLQQTQVERVKVFYHAWLGTFGSWKQLASASNADVIRAWAGLGYNRRALALRDIARQVVEQGVPDTEEGWESLKGIGPYTAAALSAFAQKKRTLPIDTNIRRVLGRFYFGKTFPELKDDTRIRRKTNTFLPTRGHYYDVPQAIFDLATTICTKIPDCARCPLRGECKAASRFLSGKVKAPKQSVAKTRERRHRNKKHPDRIYRGRILKEIRIWGQVGKRELGSLIDVHYDAKLDREWMNDMIERLVKDRLIRQKNETLYL
jgi:A/G-specific adenine glycosylase